MSKWNIKQHSHSNDINIQQITNNDRNVEHNADQHAEPAVVDCTANINWGQVTDDDMHKNHHLTIFLTVFQEFHQTLQQHVHTATNDNITASNKTVHRPLVFSECKLACQKTAGVPEGQWDMKSYTLCRPRVKPRSGILSCIFTDHRT